MPNYKHLIAEVEELATNMTDLQEFLKLIEENYDNPKRVKLIVQVYWSNMDNELDILRNTVKKMKNINLQGSRKGKKQLKTLEKASITFNIN